MRLEVRWFGPGVALVYSGDVGQGGDGWIRSARYRPARGGRAGSGESGSNRTRSEAAMNTQETDSRIVDPARLPFAYADALNAGDADAVLALFRQDATMRTFTGEVLTDPEALHAEAVQSIAAQARLTNKPRSTQIGGDTALIIVDWNLKATLPDGTRISPTGTTTAVARRATDGRGGSPSSTVKGQWDLPSGRQQSPPPVDGRSQAASGSPQWSWPVQGDDAVPVVASASRSLSLRATPAHRGTGPPDAPRVPRPARSSRIRRHRGQVREGYPPCPTARPVRPPSPRSPVREPPGAARTRSDPAERTRRRRRRALSPKERKADRISAMLTASHIHSERMQPAAAVRGRALDRPQDLRAQRGNEGTVVVDVIRQPVRADRRVDSGDP